MNKSSYLVQMIPLSGELLRYAMCVVHRTVGRGKALCIPWNAKYLHIYMHLLHYSRQASGLIWGPDNLRLIIVPLSQK